MALSERENRDRGNNMTTNSRAFNDLTRLTIDIDLFQNPFGVLYFDLRNQKEEIEVWLYETWIEIHFIYYT